MKWCGADLGLFPFQSIKPSFSFFLIFIHSIKKVWFFNEDFRFLALDYSIRGSFTVHTFLGSTRFFCLPCWCVLCFYLLWSVRSVAESFGVAFHCTGKLVGKNPEQQSSFVERNLCRFSCLRGEKISLTRRFLFINRSVSALSSEFMSCLNQSVPFLFFLRSQRVCNW